MCVHVHEARKLEKKGLFGKADPYVLITLGNAKAKTKTVSNNQSPVWDSLLRVGVDNPDAKDVILLEVFDDDIGKDDALGFVKIPIKDIYQGFDESKKWYSLEKCKSGEICVSISFTNEQFVDENVILTKHEPRQRSRSSSSPSSSSSSSSSEEEDERSDIKQLNNKLITYIDRVRMLQAGMVRPVNPETDAREELDRMRSSYEEELGVWRSKFTRAEVERETKEQEERRLEEELGRVKELLGQTSDELSKERSEMSDMRARTEVRESELLFRIRALEEDLESLRARSGESLAITDMAVNSEFENRWERSDVTRSDIYFRLKSELKKLRKKYEKETENSKREFMNVHSKQVGFVLTVNIFNSFNLRFLLYKTH